jgi:hypothetical protein
MPRVVKGDAGRSEGSAKLSVCPIALAAVIGEPGLLE